MLSARNTRPGSANIAGIEEISIAICDNSGSLDCCLDSSHHARIIVISASRTPWILFILINSSPTAIF